MEDADRASTATLSAQSGFSPATAKEEEAKLGVRVVYRSALPCAPLWQRLDAGCAGREVRERPPGLTVKRGSGHLYANPGSAAAGEAGKSGRDPEGERAGRLFFSSNEADNSGQVPRDHQDNER
ncbi:hypothetical protein AMECASPLE_004207 [Ameca splendens]|uniref:Uncharacterized protein n=1 Tax=Ameca splendens TaxID=208324 RepID=A0ABV0YAH7_9TELE